MERTLETEFTLTSWFLSLLKAYRDRKSGTQNLTGLKPAGYAGRVAKEKAIGMNNERKQLLPAVRNTAGFFMRGDPDSEPGTFSQE